MKKTRFFWLIHIAVIAIVLTACGTINIDSQNEKNDVQSEIEAVVDTTSDTTEETGLRTYEHMAGTSDIPQKPERIVTDWYYGHLVALGVKPIGTDDYVLKSHPFIEMDGTESIGQSFEKVIELNPDLIIPWGAAKYENYKKIAPTVPLELNGGPIETIQLFADILGRQEEANAWIESFESKKEESRERLATKVQEGETFTIFNVWQDTLRVYGFVNMGGYTLYDALQLTPQELVEATFKDSDDWHQTISLEAVPQFAGDHIILTTYDPEGTSTTLQELRNSEVWKSIDAVKNNRVYEVDFNDLYFDDPIAIEKQIEIFTDVILQEQ